MPSIISVYPGNDWHEREAWDLMGIVFDGHPHLTRTAMPDDWVGHPQRKDYPLGGIPVEYRGGVQLFGRGEYAYLATLTEKKDLSTIEKMFSFKIPCCLFSNDLKPPKEFLEMQRDRKSVV